MTRYLFILSLLLTAPLASREIYTWVDKNGIRHISDTPNSNDAITRPLPEAPSNTIERVLIPLPEKEQTPQQTSPLSINIVSPSHGETIRDNTGTVSVKIELNRELTRNEQLQLIMDKEPVGAPSTKKVWLLKNVERGAHSFSIQLVVSGKIIASSSLVTVYLHQASVN